MIYCVTVPPENSVVVWPDCKYQQTLPVSKVWLLALIETDFTFISTAEKSNFQLIRPIEEPSVRAMYTLTKTTQVKTHTARLLYSLNILLHFFFSLDISILLPNVIHIQEKFHLCFETPACENEFLLRCWCPTEGTSFQRCTHPFSWYFD